MFTTCSALVLPYLMPAVWWASLFLCVLISAVVWCVRWRHQVDRKVGIDEMGAFIMEKGQYKRLCFVRANAFQLIAKEDREPSVLERLWPRYWVIYRDNLVTGSYLVLRSYAAQQILQRRNEKAKNATTSDS